MLPTAWQDQKLAAAHLLAAVSDLKTMGCYVLEYPKANPAYHRPDSRHSATGFGGRACAADVNRNPNGEPERKWYETTGQYIAFGHGLSVTCGIYGFVPNHSGSNMHLHIDDGVWSNIGRGVFRTPKAAQPSLPAWPVRTFQKAHNLAVDGVPGKATISALQKLVGAKVDGVAGRETWTKVQAKVGAAQDGIPGGETFFKLGQAIEAGTL